MGHSYQGPARDGGSGGAICGGVGHLAMQGHLLPDRLHAQSIALQLSNCETDQQLAHGIVEQDEGANVFYGEANSHGQYLEHGGGHDHGCRRPTLECADVQGGRRRPI
ncbi:hypothetical protein O988_00484 [Pseudogymnoascus sp. VKM F-3808]|nr:hypothetical protein O988_00484 [Pseudogymnoascus sp. VKM F-3808]